MEREKLCAVFEAMQGFTYLEWTRVRYTIDRSFDSRAKFQKNMILMESPDELLERLGMERLF